MTESLDKLRRNCSGKLSINIWTDHECSRDRVSLKKLRRTSSEKTVPTPILAHATSRSNQSNTTEAGTQPRHTPSLYLNTQMLPTATDHMGIVRGFRHGDHLAMHQNYSAQRPNYHRFVDPRCHGGSTPWTHT